MTRALRAAAVGLAVLALSGCAGLGAVAEAVGDLGTATGNALLSVPRLTCPAVGAPPDPAAAPVASGQVAAIKPPN